MRRLRMSFLVALLALALSWADRAGAQDQKTPPHLIHRDALVEMKTGSLPVAEEMFRKAAELRQADLGATHPDTLDSMTRLAEVQFDLGHEKDSVATIKRIYKAIRRLPPDRGLPSGLVDLQSKLLLNKSTAHEFFLMAGDYLHQIARLPKESRLRRELAPALHDIVPDYSQVRLIVDMVDILTEAELRLLKAEWEELDRNRAVTRVGPGTRKPDPGIAWQLIKQTMAQLRTAPEEQIPGLMMAYWRVTATQFFGGRHQPFDRDFIAFHLTIRAAEWQADGMPKPVLARLRRMNDTLLFLFSRLPDPDLVYLANLWDAAISARDLAKRQAELGPDHAELPPLLDELGVLQHRLGHHRHAERLFGRALAIRLKTLPADHLDLADAMDHWALQLNHLGRMTEADEQFTAARIIREKRLGAEHPLVVDSLNHLAISALLQGREAEAKTLLDRGETILKLTSRTYLAGSVNDAAQAVLAQRLGRRDEALSLAQRARAKHMGVTGHGNPTLDAMVRTATHNCGWTDNYGPSQQDIHRYSQKPFPPRGPALHNLALLVSTRLPRLDSHFHGACFRRGDDTPMMQRPLGFAEMEPLRWRQFDMIRLAGGPDAPWVPGALAEVARFYLDHGRFERGESVLRSALDTAVDQAPEGETAFRLRMNLAVLHLHGKRFAPAERLLARNRQMAERWLAEALETPDNDWLVIHRLNMLGHAWATDGLRAHLQGRKDQAASLYRDALTLHLWAGSANRKRAERSPDPQRDFFQQLVNRPRKDPAAKPVGPPPLGGSWPVLVQLADSEIPMVGLALLMLDGERREDGLRLLRLAAPDGRYAGPGNRLADLLLLESLAQGQFDLARSMLTRVARMEDRLRKMESNLAGSLGSRKDQERWTNNLRKQFAEPQNAFHHDILQRMQQAGDDRQKRRDLAHWARHMLTETGVPDFGPALNQAAPTPVKLLINHMVAARSSGPITLPALDPAPDLKGAAERLVAVLDQAGQSAAARWVADWQPGKIKETQHRPVRVEPLIRMGDIYKAEGRDAEAARKYEQVLDKRTHDNLSLLRRTHIDPGIRKTIGGYLRGSAPLWRKMDKDGRAKLLEDLAGALDNPIESQPLGALLTDAMARAEADWKAGHAERAEEYLLVGRLLGEVYLNRFDTELASVLMSVKDIKARVAKQTYGERWYPDGLSGTIVFSGDFKRKPVPKEMLPKPLNDNDRYLRGLHGAVNNARIIAKNPVGLNLANQLKFIDRTMPRGIPYHQRFALRKKEMEIREVLQPGDNPDMADLLTRLGTSHFALGNMAEGQKLYARGVEMLKRIHGPHHAKVIEELRSLAFTLRGYGYEPLSRQYYEMARNAEAEAAKTKAKGD